MDGPGRDEHGRERGRQTKDARLLFLFDHLVFDYTNASKEN